MTSDDNIEFGMTWTRNKQTFYYGEDKFSNEGPITTFPSHDLAHLLVAANGDLEWKPVGEDRVIRLAEYNAVFLEHIYVNVFRCVETEIKEEVILPSIKNYMIWFAEKHYAPFPISANEAHYQFCSKINLPVLVRLSPIMFQQLRQEKLNNNSKDINYKVSFKLNDVPVIEETDTFQKFLSELLELFKKDGLY